MFDIAPSSLFIFASLSVILFSSFYAQKESEHRYEEAILQAKGKADKERKKIFTENTAKINRLGDIEKDKMLRVLDEVFRERI